MRSRTNAAHLHAGASNGGGAVEKTQDDDDSNAKGKPKFKLPPKAFSLPPPPKMASLSVRNSNSNGIPANDDGKSLSTPNGQNSKSSGNDVSGNDVDDIITSSVSTPALVIPITPVPIPIPPPPASTSAVYQRANRKPQPSEPKATTATVIATSEGNNVAPTTSYGSGSYSQSYSAQQIISHPYKPSSWYADARKTQRRRQVGKAVFCAVLAISLSAFLWWGYQQYLISHPVVPTKKRHKNYHHHDNHHNVHPMMGIGESPLGFSKESTPEKKSYRQIEQEPTSYDQSSGVNNQLLHEIFSTVPVTKLSNEKHLPYVGFGVTSRSIEHKQIPIIVATLLQYASSETEGGGGIAMIDAVIDEDRKLENSGGSLQYSITNKVVEHYEEQEEKLESSMAKTVVALVGRAITFFGKDKNKQRSSGAIAKGGGSESGGKDGDPYDYENRLEVHLIVGLSGPDLGAENTIAALRGITAELDGLVPPLPIDALVDPSEWKMPQSSLLVIDRHVDVRLHVLLRLNHCHDKNHSLRVTSCSSNEESNKELLARFIDSYAILEKLYESKIIYGLGLDGIHGEDIQYLLRKSKIKPQLYRGDVSQALDIVRKNHHKVKDTHVAKHIATVLKENNITFLASNVAGHILERKAMAPNAYALLQNLGGVLYRAHHEKLNAPGASSGHKGEGEYYTVPRVVLSYLVRHKICVLPHAYKAEHLADDAPEWVGGLAKVLTERRVAEIGMALRALLSEEDLPEEHGLGMEGEDEVAVVFHNLLVQEVHLFREKETESGSRSESAGFVKGDSSIVVIAQKGDKIEAVASDGQKRGTYAIDVEAGGSIDFTIPAST